jgi:hypothetical protein
MAFVAHIVTHDAGGLTPPEVAVTEANDLTGVAETIISYPLPAGARVSDAIALLHTQGWSLYGTRRYMEPGYWLLQVQACDWSTIVQAVTNARHMAEIHVRCCDLAYRAVLSAARGVDHSVTALGTVIVGTSSHS